MAPSLRISAGASVDSLSVLHVNDESKPLTVSTDDFEGRLVVRIKGFTGELPSKETVRCDTSYFDHSYASGCSWSIGIQGRFKNDVDVDDVEFGNLFDEPIRDRLPWGTSAALHAISYIDPNLHHDVYADKPWAFSPLICTMTRINVERLSGEVIRQGSMDDWPPLPQGSSDSDYVQEDTSALLCAKGTTELDSQLEQDGYADLHTLSQLRSSNDAANAHRNRGRFWGNESVRQATKFTPESILTMDFCQGYIRFSDLHLQIAGMSFDLTAYHDGQPVRFVARNKQTGKAYFVIEFQIVAKEA